MHKFNLFENILNLSGKENRLCFEEAPSSAPLPEEPTETAEAEAKAKADREAREAEKRAKEEEAKRKAEAEKRAAAGAEPAAGLVDKAEKQPPKSYEFTYDKEKGEGVFTITLADGTTKKSTKIIVPTELKDKVVLATSGVDPDNQSRDGTECISIEVDKKTGVWLVYQHKEDKFVLIGTDDFYKNGNKLGDYQVSQLADGNFEIKKVEPEETAEAKEVNMQGRLTLPDLQAKLKEIKVEATDEQIKKAFKYYALDYNDEKGYIDGYDEKTKTKEILDGVKQLIKDGKIKKENLAYIGSVDGTHYLPAKVLKQSKKWHEEKRDALEVLLGFISNNSVIFSPNDKAPDDETQKLIKDYISKVGPDLDGAKQLVKDNESAFTKKQGIFNMALAVQRAKDIKSRVLDDKKETLNSSTDIIRIELGTDGNTPADRKSGLLLLDANNGIIPPERDPEIKEVRVRGEVTPQERTQGEVKPKSQPSDEEEQENPPEERVIEARVEPKQGTSAQVTHDADGNLKVQGGQGTIKRKKDKKLPDSHDPAAGKQAKPAVGEKAKEQPAQQEEQPAKAEAASETIKNPIHSVRKSDDGYEWIIVKQANGKEWGCKIAFERGQGLAGHAKVNPGTDFITFTIDGNTLHMDFTKPGELPFSVEDDGKFFKMYTFSYYKYRNEIVFGILPESKQWKLYWQGQMNKKTGLDILTWVEKVYDNIDLKKEEQNLLNGLNAVPQSNKDYMNTNAIKIILNKNEYFGKEDTGLNKKMNRIVINYWESPKKITETINNAVTEHKANANLSKGGRR